MTALLIYATATLPFVASNIVTTDTVLTACETLAMLGFVLAWTDLDKSESATAPNPRVVQFHRRWLLLMWAAFGLAFMTKGPPGLLPLAAMIDTVVATSGVRAVSGLFHPIGLGVFLFVGLPWYLYVVMDSPELGHYFITNEVIGRVTGEHHRNGEWYHALTYLALLVGGMFPWSIDWFRPATMRRLAEARYGLGQDRVTLLLLLWVAVPLSVFMIVSSRMPLYILPLMAPLAIATARLKPAGWWSSNQGCRTIVTGAVILLAVRIGLGLAPIGRDARQWARSMPRPVPIVEVVFVDLQPRYGIGFYLGVEVEEVSLIRREIRASHSTPSWTNVRGTFCSSSRRPRNRRYPMP